MASTYSTNLALELIATGEQSGTWGTTTNTNLGTLLEQAISGYVTQAITDGADTTITIPNGTTGVARNMFIECTGALTAGRNLIVPANKKLYFIYNNTTGGFAVTVKVSGQTGVSVANGKKVLLVSNGTDIVLATNSFSGSFDGTVGATTPSTGAFTTLDASGTTTLGASTERVQINRLSDSTNYGLVSLNGLDVSTTTCGMYGRGSGGDSGKLFITGIGSVVSQIAGVTVTSVSSTGLAIGTATSGSSWKNLFLSDYATNASASATAQLILSSTSYYLGIGNKSSAWIFGEANGSAAGSLMSTTWLTVGATTTSVGTDVNIGFTKKLSVLAPAAAGAIVAKTVEVGYPVLAGWNAADSGDNIFTYWYVNAAGDNKGSIGYNRAANLVAYNTTSDATLKNLIGDAPQARSLEILSQTRLREYSWKEDVTNKPQIGVIAQELVEVFPGAVSVGGDLAGVDEDGNPTTKYHPWSVDKTAYQFHLVAGWQNHEAKIEALEARLAALEAK